MALTDLLFRPSVLTPLLLMLLCAMYGRFQRLRHLPKDIPWANGDERIKAAKSAPEKLRAMKENYTDKGLKYLHKPSGLDPVLMLPPSEIPWIISQPESILSAQETHRDQLQSDWTFLNANIVKEPIHQDVIRSNMVRKLDAFTDPVMDELRQCFEDYWGTSTEWHEVNLWDSMLKFFARTSNRMFVGLPMCRNESFLDGCRGFATDIIVSAQLLRLIPSLVKPALGYLAIAPNWWHYRKAAQYLIPVIESRQEKLKQNPDKDPADVLPNDFVTWSIINALSVADPSEQTPELIAKRTMTTNFAAIHTTTTTSTNFLMDLLGSDPKKQFLEDLIEEVMAVNDRNSGDWSKASLAAMTRTDSALRESMRLSGFVVTGIERKVVAKDGVTLPDGTHVPYWGNIAVPAWSIHHDDEVYEKPFEYNAFRFSRQREALSDGSGSQVHVGEEGLVEGEQGYMTGENEKKGDGEPNGHVKGSKDLNRVLEGRNLSSVTTSSQFMQFGHGKLSCPGRFFAVQEIKLMTAYMLLNYEIKYLPSRPAPKWFSFFAVPDSSATITVRRRSGTVKA